MKATRLKELLEQYEYDILETQFLYKGFTEGFNLEYQGPKARQSQSRNIPITVGCNTTMWNKLIKEIQEKRVAGPYEQIPFANFIQSPIGLVPKSGSLSGDMRLIFHLSYCNGYGFLVRVLSYRTLRFDFGSQCALETVLRRIYFLMIFYLIQSS